MRQRTLSRRDIAADSCPEGQDELTGGPEIVREFGEFARQVHRVPEEDSDQNVWRMLNPKVC